jgi:hypothetical protein
LGKSSSVLLKQHINETERGKTRKTKRIKRNFEEGGKTGETKANGNESKEKEKRNPNVRRGVLK